MPNTNYQASFYAKCNNLTDEELTVGIMSTNEKKMYATSIVKIKTGGWHKYSLSFKTVSDFTKTAGAKFVIIGRDPGKYFFNLVSLFPPTYKGRINGNRPDLMQMLAEMKPSFLRFPGGNFLEGGYFGTRFPWKNSLGPLEQRPGHEGCWGYRVSDGMGLLEFLEWCEDLHMEPLLAVYAGYSLAGDHVDAGPLLEPYVEEALDEIEYVTGGVDTKWGAVRAKNGHPKPFKLSYIEIGNEDGFDKSHSYDGRFIQFRKAINAKYPNLHCISTIDHIGKGNTASSRPDMIDEHYYRDAWQMEEDANHYDSYNRKTSPKIFVGEWATREGTPTTNMNAAIGDAAWMMGMERNSDIVLKAAYAPLLVNISQKNNEFPKAWQWDSDLIGYDALNSFGSPSYYAQKMFNTHLGDKVVPVKGSNIPLKTAIKRDSVNTWEKPKKNIIPALYYNCTKNSRGGLLYLKIVNASGKVVPLNISLNGKEKIAARGEMIVLKSGDPDETNTIQEPRRIIPIQTKIDGIKNKFSRNIEPYSINIIQIHLTK
jgi:alpha-N-arabinofuranosidase